MLTAVTLHRGHVDHGNSCYRAPGRVETVLTAVTLHRGHVDHVSSLDPNIKTYIMGDFNINLLNISLLENVLNLMISRNYYPVITRPTRATPISCTLIANIFCNRIDEIESTGVITINISDHYPIFSRELRPSHADNVLSIKYRVFSDENLSNFRISLQYANWEPILNNDDANESYELFQIKYIVISF